MLEPPLLISELNSKIFRATPALKTVATLVKVKFVIWTENRLLSSSQVGPTLIEDTK